MSVIASRLRAPPVTVVEPTCGVGAFLVAARSRFDGAALRGYEVNDAYVDAARLSLGASASVTRADFFSVDWRRELASLRDPILVVGNPPWVTAAGLGALGAKNLPAERDARGLKGLDARTGRSNFDVSEAMLLRLVEALAGRDATVAVLCKSSVARRLVERASRGAPIAPLGMWRVNARAHFAAAVDACLFAFETRLLEGVLAVPVFASLDAREACQHLGVIDGAAVSDVGAWRDTSHLAGSFTPEWRSGMKHDCAAVMELRAHGGRWRNGAGEEVEVEDAVRFPLLKGTEVSRGVSAPTRAVIVTQRRLGDDTARLEREAPEAWRYLTAHRGAFEARRSSIYRSQPPFAVFGVGDYSFAPWKVAISGLHKRLSFTLVAPHEGRPVMLDDTCYFAPFEREEAAREAHSALSSEAARAFFEARVHWDAKRPIHKSLLQSLDLARLIRACR